MWQGGDFPLDLLDQIRWREGELEGKKKKEKEEKKRKEKKRGVRSSNFFPKFMVIGPSVLIGPRGKVGPRSESYARGPKSLGFAKLREVGIFLLLGLILV